MQFDLIKFFRLEIVELPKWLIGPTGANGVNAARTLNAPMVSTKVIELRHENVSMATSEIMAVTIQRQLNSKKGVI